MYANQYEEHLAHSAPCASRFDGFDRGDDVRHEDSGETVIGRMTSGGGYRVTIVNFWQERDSSRDEYFEVFIDGSRVHSTDDRTQAITVARWWMAGCPA